MINDQGVPNLLYAYEDLFPLMELIHGLKSLSATYRGKKVHPYRFIFQIWRNVRECTQDHNNSMNNRHCWFATDSPGWGCKYLNRIFRDPQGPGNYKTSNKYWYNFGSFDEAGRWIINKNYLLEKLNQETEEKALDTCPHFDIERVREAIRNLPGTVEIDNLHFKKYCISEYENGQRVDKAVNIRHLKTDTDPLDLRKMLEKYDYMLGKISIN